MKRQDEIISLAESRGYKKKDTESWFLQCCSIQQWLRESHNIVTGPQLSTNTSGLEYVVVTRSILAPPNSGSFMLSHGREKYDSHQEALEAALLSNMELV